MQKNNEKLFHYGWIIICKRNEEHTMLMTSELKKVFEKF